MATVVAWMHGVVDRDSEGVVSNRSGPVGDGCVRLDGLGDDRSVEVSGETERTPYRRSGIDDD